jgi:ABC-type oligopeptide transport system substrate-binding subunit
LEFDKNDIETLAIKLERQITISVGYDDFYPNKIIAKFIKAQLLKSNIKMNLVKDNYYNPQFNYDMKLSLFFPEYLDDLSFYRSSYNHALLKFINKQIPKCLYKKFYRTKQLSETNNLLLDNALIIPLFKMNSVYLATNKTFDFRICNFEIFL